MMPATTLPKMKSQLDAARIEVQATGAFLKNLRDNSPGPKSEAHTVAVGTALEEHEDALNWYVVIEDAYRAGARSASAAESERAYSAGGA